jgi:hypothetical protein
MEELPGSSRMLCLFADRHTAGASIIGLSGVVRFCQPTA